MVDNGSIYGRVEIDTGDSVPKLRAVGQAVDDLNGRGSGALSGLSSIEKYGQNITTVGQGLIGFGAILTGISVISGKTAMDFEQAMSNVAAVSGGTAEQMERAEQVVLDVGYQTTMSATEAAAALEILIKAGVDLDAALDGVLLSAVNLAEATGVDITLAAETAATAMNIFGYEAEEASRVVDAMSQSANASSLDVNDWALALKYAGPVVASLGWDIEDLAEMMIILGDAGIKGEVGATAIRNILLALSNPTQEITDAFGQYNVALFDANGNLRSMDEITGDLALSWGNMTQAEKLAFAELVAGKQGVSSFMALMEDQTKAVNEGGSAFDRARKRMEEAGTTAEMAEKRMDNLAGSVEELKGTVETLMITFMSGLTPAIRWVTDGLAAFLQMFLRLPGPIQTAIAGTVAITGFLALLGGTAMITVVKIAEFVAAFRALGGMAAVMKNLTAATTGLRAALISLQAAVPVLLLIAALAGALYLAYRTNFLGFADLVDGVIGKLKDMYDIVHTIFGSPLSNSATLNLETASSTTYDDWVQMPDGTWKNATLDITATGSGPAFVTKVEDASAADGWSYTLNIDVDGDGVPDALKIIDSVDQGGGNYVLTVEMGENQYQVWYDEESGQAILVPVEVETGEANSRIRATMKLLDEMMQLAQNLDPFKNLQGASDAAFGWLNRIGAQITSILELIASWSWDAIQNTTAFQWVQNRIRDIQQWFGEAADAWITFTGVLATGVDGFLDWAKGPFDWFMQRIEEAKQAWTGFKNWVSGDDSRVPETTTNPETGVSRTPRLPLTEDERAARGPEQRSPSQLMGRAIGMVGGRELDDAIQKLRDLGSAADETSPKLLSTNTAMNLTASSGPILGSSMDTAGTQVKGAGDGILSTFLNMATGAITSAGGMAIGVGGAIGGMAAAVPAQLASMTTGSVSQFMAMNTGAVGQVGALQGSVSGQMAALVGDVSSKAATANTSAVSQFSSMSAAAIGRFSGMQVGAAVQMALITSRAGTEGNATGAALVGALSGAVVRVAGVLSMIPGIVSSIGGQAAGAAYAAGANISASFAAGMYAFLGSIIAAANAMVAAADAAVRARARIASPSKLFQALGAFMGQGMELGILASIPGVARASDRLVYAAMPSPGSMPLPTSPGYGFGFGGGGSTVINQQTTLVYTLTSEEWTRQQDKVDRAQQATTHLSDPRGFKQYRGRR